MAPMILTSEASDVCDAASAAPESVKDGRGGMAAALGVRPALYVPGKTAVQPTAAGLIGSGKKTTGSLYWFTRHRRDYVHRTLIAPCRRRRHS
jgi:hypothetical protein